MLFQSTHPRGVRQKAQKSLNDLRVVSIHAPAWGATMIRRRRGSMVWFQSTHPRGVRLFALLIASSPCLFQSTHPRGVRHASVSMGASDAMFQSTHPRGVRLTRLHIDCFNIKFQSTHPRGVRLLQARLCVGYRGVSIHAPAWGATGLKFN